jgi:hypothetical protein
MNDTKKPSYPESCPKCRTASGWPYSAGTCDRPGVITVKLRCQQCGHEWGADAPKVTMASVTVLPRRDRRSGTRHGIL